METEETAQAREWASTSFEEALAPAPNERIEEALLTTYSADLKAIVVALHALAGYSTDNDPKKMTLVRTLEELRTARIRIAFQKGRLRGGTRARIAGILDRYLHSVACNEANGSWHPKMAIVRFREIDETSSHGRKCTWRFWLGSRNLCSAESAELGLSLQSDSTGKGQPISGMSDAVKALALRSGYSNAQAERLRKELENVRWRLPDGFRSIEVRHHGSPSGTNSLPANPGELDELVVISPFLNASTLHALAGWGNAQTKRTLVSTQMSLEAMARLKSAPLRGFNSLLAFGNAEIEDTESESLEQNDEEFTPYQRLHAKLIAVRRGAKGTLWMGSANATERGWGGANAELTARIDVHKRVWEGLQNWLNRGTIVEQDSLNREPDPDEQKEALFDAEQHRIVAGWKAKLRYHARTTAFVSEEDLALSTDAFELMIGLFTHEAMHSWIRGTRLVQMEGAPLAEQTRLVRVKLLYRGNQIREWLELCDVENELIDARDTAALSEYLGAANLIRWWKEMLDGSGSEFEDDPSWDSDENHVHSSTGHVDIYQDEMTLEDLLRGWARSPVAFQRSGDRIAEYIEHIQQAAPNAGENCGPLNDIYRLWRLLEDKTR